MFNSGFRSLSKFGFKCSGIQQRGTVVLDSMSFEALSCQGGASICICTSKISFDFPCITGLAFTWVYYSNIATLYVHRQCLVLCTGYSFYCL